MTIFQAIVLGLVQGFTEFLPVSSSAHLSLIPWLLDWETPGLSFDVALHLGSLVAVAWYFRNDWKELILAFFEIVKTRRIDTIAQRRVLLLIVATIPAGIAGLILKDYAETVFRHPAVTAVSLIVLGLLLWYADQHFERKRTLTDARLKDALYIGIAQILALIPGVSRSGSTITAGRVLGFARPEAARFSFLMSFPIIIAAVVLKAPDVIAEGGSLSTLTAGIAASAISSWMAISILIRFVSKRSFSVFAVYRVVLGISVLYLLLSRGANGLI